METFLTYLQVFAVGGTICLIGQVIINTTKVTSARILVGYLLLGVILETAGVYKYIRLRKQPGARRYRRRSRKRYSRRGHGRY